MKKSLTKIIILITLALSINPSCDLFWAPESISDYDNAGFPSAGGDVSDGSGSGKDALSTSTNHSDKAKDPRTKANGFAGASFVKPPQINNYGTVSLSYTVEVPGGRAGMQPSVGLGYSSSSGDGLVGIGWNLSTGLSVISRTTRNGQLYYDIRDTFTFNGKRLVKVEGNSDSENGTYRLEIESGFSKFVLSNIENGGIWHVYDKSGTLTVLGDGLSCRIYHPDDDSKTYTWQFTRSVDLNGNYMIAEYDTSEYESNHILYLKEIRYTGNNNTSDAPARQYVRFHLKERSDAYVSKAPGFVMRMDKLLDYVEVGWDDPGIIFSGEKELWRYTMVYEISEDSSRPLLKTVDSTRTSTQPEFIYQPAVHNLVWKKVANPNYNDNEFYHENTKYFEGDFNGDGLSDMVFFNPETGYWRGAEATRDGYYVFKVYGNRYRGYDSPEKIQFFKGNVTGDYNGDGKSDIAFYLPETKDFYVAEHNGRTFEFKRYGRLYLTDVDIFKCEWFTGDYDGNGLSDALLYNEPTGEWILMTNEGGSFEFVKFDDTFKNLFRDDYSPDKYLNSEFTSDDSEYGRDRDKVHFLSGDYNGDGRTDVSIYDSRDGKWWVGENYRNDGAGAEFKLEWRLYKIFTAPEQALFGHDRFSGDFNGDGFSDFLIFDKETAEWTIGETGDGTINFRVFSHAPQFKEITRWLQGDFNGDGRTDIGFYSSTDNNFWIGEATPTGFRYVVYNNLSYGPDPKRVLETPLPMDEVMLKNGRALLAGPDSTSILDYKYDSNWHAGRGEKVYAGNFMGQADNALNYLLIYKRTGVNKGFNYLKNIDGKEVLQNQTALNLIDPEDPDIRILNGGKPIRDDDRDVMLYYQASGEFHTFNKIYYEGDSFTTAEIGRFTNSEVFNFNIDQSLHLTADFEANDKKQVLALNEGVESEPNFVLLDESSSTPVHYTVTMDGSPYGSINQILQSYRNNRQMIQFFTGRFTVNDTEPEQILMVDMRDQYQHYWYLGTVDNTGGFIDFTSADSTVLFEFNGYNGIYNVSKNDEGLTELVYATFTDKRVRFHRLTITGDLIGGFDIEQYSYSLLQSGLTFNGEFDHDGNPVVYDGTSVKRVNLNYESSITFDDITNISGVSHLEIKRDDLMTDVYPFRWIQGDYNGDGKTDIGIFHLKERDWYFANTTGTVPDMINRVENGIGGTYDMEYENSTKFDNTGDDDIPDLPMNYKVCTKLTVSDGRSQSDVTYTRIVTKYEYANGYAFSSFINGYKETDYFGFGDFSVIDAKDGKDVSSYYNVPYDDFRKNRALAGAIKESRFVGSDGVEYSKTSYEYKMHEIFQSPKSNVQSYLVEPVEVKKFVKGTLVETRGSNIVLTPGEYAMESKTDSVTDHYTDGVHSAVTIRKYSEFENVSATNEMRIVVKKAYLDISNETTSDYEYDENGNLTKETLSYTGAGKPGPALGTVAPRVVEYAYDGYGNRTRVTNSSASPARVVETGYDEILHQFLIMKKSFTDTGELVTRYTINYSTAFGEVDTMENPNGNKAYSIYDDLGRIKELRADTDNADAELLSRYYYNPNFPMSAKTLQYTGIDGKRVETRVYTDGLGRGIHTVQSATEEQGKRYTKTGIIIYDELGRVIRSSQKDWAKDDEIDVYRPVIYEKNPAKSEYDPSGRVSKTILQKAYPGEEETSLSFTYNDPWEVVETHSIGRSKRTIKNARGQVLYIKDWGRGDDGVFVKAKIGFVYDVAGNRIKKTDLVGNDGVEIGMDGEVPGPMSNVQSKDTSGYNVAYWWFDGFGQLRSSSDPDFGYTEFTYNAFGDQESVTDAREKRTELVYDRLGRVVEKILPDDEGTVTYTYDSLSGMENTLGRLVQINDPVQVKQFSYDRLGRAKMDQRRIKDSGVDSFYRTTYTHDLLNRSVAIEYPREARAVNSNRITSHYTYNSIGVTSVGISFGGDSKSLINSINYNEFGQMTRITRGNGTVTNYTYDKKRRLTKLTTTNGSGALQDVDYEFDTQNSIKTVLNRPVEGTFESTIRYNYIYDGLNRLINATGNYNKTDNSGVGENISRSYERGYSYAPNGNLTGKSIFDLDNPADDDIRTYTYENHAVQQIDSSKDGPARFEMEYDASGNMTSHFDSKGGLQKNMVYDSSNRITKVTNEAGDTIGRYYYDDQGFRVRKVANMDVEGEARNFEIMYPSKYFAVERQRESGDDVDNTFLVVNNIYLYGVRIAATIPSGDAIYYLTDQVDSVKVIVDDTGNAVSRMEYLPYGGSWFQEGEISHSPKYNSQELDKETGFYFYNARHYDPEIGRFLTADNVIPYPDNTQSWNRYSYVKNNPISYKDPTGHYEKDVHHDLSYFLAIKAGIDEESATEIAQYNQYTDDSSDTFTYRPTDAGKELRQQYHFATDERLSVLEKNVKDSNYDTKEIGTLLHATQDSKYSHKNYINEGKHLTTDIDKTYNDPEKAKKMAIWTFNKLNSISGKKNKLSESDMKTIEKFIKEKDVKKKKAILEKALGKGKKIPKYVEPKNIERENDRWVVDE